MRIERWWWLVVFLFISFCLHVGAALRSPHLGWRPIVIAQAKEFEVSLEPLKPDRPKPELKPKEKKPELRLPEKPKPEIKPERLPNPKTAERRVRPPREIAKPKEKVGPQRIIETTEKRPQQPNAEPGGFDPEKEEKPIPLGVPLGQREAAIPRFNRERPDINPGGGGSPAPGPALGGNDGAPGPEHPIEDVVFNGGGRGGLDLPREAPRVGGGGGQSILSVNDPKALLAEPEERPGLGSGRGGGQGLGAGGGVGVARGRGIGTRPDGKRDLGSLLAKAGPGIGAGEGNKIGTRAPGGGRGTGSELPGTGGTGLGYGRGSGIGFGNGRGAGFGNGDGGGRGGLTRGIPFGDITGLLAGDPNGGGGRGGGPGGPGRGNLFGTKGGGGGGAVHMVYVLDTSGSMGERAPGKPAKIDRAREALKKAISELKRGDTFAIVNFDDDAHAVTPAMVEATPENIERARDWVDGIQLHPGTNISAGMEVAFSYAKITHVFLLSDGEPSRGIRNPLALRDLVKRLNGNKAQVITMALGLGEDFNGIELLKGIAEDNEGKFTYVNLAQ